MRCFAFIAYNSLKTHDQAGCQRAPVSQFVLNFQQYPCITLLILAKETTLRQLSEQLSNFKTRTIIGKNFRHGGRSISNLIAELMLIMHVCIETLHFLYKNFEYIV